MSPTAGQVPYGYEPPVQREKGTLIYYDTFEETTDEQLDVAAETAKARAFERFVLYPIHEETAKRMSKAPVSAYYKREKRLAEWAQSRAPGQADPEIDRWEGKRKKYTPMEAALRHLTETLPGPHFVYMTPDTANLFASYDVFETWIAKIRLILSAVPASPAPLLERYRSRWNLAWEDE
ncbi:hypothetical protein [Cohnella sp. JJ-181]|uniref:hypothetical protein n=1 Tax=Cohnella rhizoplanae TaxID=2974897 RepID=UPI0022FFB748|nr:hypothetical protein [Cohnella sp. JJ-181]CAI6087091.1 hypothetical protein COHCIP112018_05325 [Cohnella sp. JJ-181]